MQIPLKPVFHYTLASMKTLVEKAGLCALNRIFGFEPKIGHALISNIGSATELFEMKSSEIDDILGPFSKYKGKLCRKELDSSAEELESLSRKGITFLGFTESSYPTLLGECNDPPIGLYIRSTSPPEELFNRNTNIAIIGTRDISPYGKECCRQSVMELASTTSKPVIVSGLALGADYHAHSAALEFGLPTIGVMATGPESIYPVRHHNIAERIVNTPGCALITDYPPGTSPMAIHFLRRNRIIAGLCETTILIESKIKGGGMTTSRLAFNYNRSVYAFPGRVDDIRSQGCNLLIREKIAEPITDISRVAGQLGLKTGKAGKKPSAPERIQEAYIGKMPTDRIDLMTHLLLKIKENRGICIDDLASSFTTSYSTIRSLVELLELDGFITIDILQRCSIKTLKSE